MRVVIFMIVALQIESIVGQENEEMFMCRRAGQGSASQVLYGGTDGVKLGKSSDNGNKAPSKDQIINILEERLRVLEMRVMLLESKTNPSQSPRSDQELSDLVEDGGSSTPPTEPTSPSVNAVSHKHCQIFHRERCFTFVKMDQGAIGFKDGQKKCRNLKGELANIYDEEHFAKIEGYLQQHANDNDRQEYFIVGMTYNVKKNTVYLRGGVKASFVKWYSDDYPNRRSRTNTKIHVQFNHQSVAGGNGMYNVSPNSRARSALCEIRQRYL